MVEQNVDSCFDIFTLKTVLKLLDLISLANLCFAGCSPCNYDLVTGPYGVSNAALSASSTFSSAPCHLHKVRFSSSIAWCPANKQDGHYIQVEFQTNSTLKAVQTLGRGDLDQWVTSYVVNISMDGIDWNSILTNGDVKVFSGNTDSHTVVTNRLAPNVVAKFIRIIAVSGYNNDYASMRLEVKGCPVANLPSTCNQWAATLGSAGDVFPVLEETNAANHGLCGLICYEKPDCDSFVFNIGSHQCMLLKSTPDASYATVDLNNVWYFTKY